MSILEVILGAILLTLCTLSPANGQLTKAAKQNLLDYHNAWRSRVANGQVSGQPSAANMVLMDWDDGAADRAQRWASQCVDDHDNRDQRLYGRYQWVGQNMASWGPADSHDDTFAVEMWDDEQEDYSFQSNTCKNICGHYTQVVWHNSARLGCGVTRTCPSEYKTSAMAFCNYAPGGNMNDDRPYTRGPVCSKCPFGYTKCMAGLCATPEQCQRAGVSCSASVVDSQSRGGWVFPATNRDGVIARVGSSGGNSNNNVLTPAPTPSKNNNNGNNNGNKNQNNNSNNVRPGCVDKLDTAICRDFGGQCSYMPTIQHFCAKTCGKC